MKLKKISNYLKSNSTARLRGGATILIHNSNFVLLQIEIWKFNVIFLFLQTILMIFLQTDI